MFDFETAAKLGALIGVFTGVKTALENIAVLRHKKLKDDYELAKAFFSDTANEIDREFVEQRGFQALSGVPGINALVARQLIALDSSGQLLRNYGQARKFLTSEERGSGLLFVYSPKYEKKWVRKLHQVLCVVVMLTCLFFVSASVLLPVLVENVSDPNATTMLINMVGFSIGGILAFLRAEGMLKAIELVNSQPADCDVARV